MVVYLCKICNQEDLPNSDSTTFGDSRGGRRKKKISESQPTNWVFCDSCSSWVHIDCCGLQVENLSASAKFKCTVCCIKAAIGNKRRSDIANIFTAAVKEKINKVGFCLETADTNTTNSQANLKPVKNLKKVRALVFNVTGH